MNRRYKKGLIGLIIGFSLVLLVTTITINSYDVIGVHNISTITKVNVTNTEPNLYDVEITPSAIDLNPGEVINVNCTGYIYDINGWDDVTLANATLYDTNYGDGSTFDNNYRYLNESCECTQLDSEASNATCNCQFDVWYYANNASWECNMTISDQFGLSDTLKSPTADINPVVAIDAPAEIDYGNLSVTETSLEKQADIRNFGNVAINVSVNGYGGTDSGNKNNLSMICETGNISLDNERYAITSGESFSNMIELTNITTQIKNFGLSKRTNDITYGNDTNTTYWRLKIPADVSGFCNGTIEFHAVDDS